MNLPGLSDSFFRKVIFLSLLLFLNLSSLSAQTVTVNSVDDNASSAGDMGSAIAAVNAGTDNTINFGLASSNPITLGSVVGGLGTVSFTQAVTLTNLGALITPQFDGVSTLSTGSPVAAAAVTFLSTSSLNLNSFIGTMSGGTEGTNATIYNGANSASVTASSFNMTGNSFFSITGGELSDLIGNNDTAGAASLMGAAVSIDNSFLTVIGSLIYSNNSGIADNADAGTASVTAGSLYIGDGSAVSVTGGAVSFVGGTCNAVAGGNASVTANSVTLNSATFSVTGGEFYGNQGGTNPIGGSAAVTLGSASLSNSSVTVAGGMIYAFDSSMSTAQGGAAWVTAGSVTMTSSTLNVAGGEEINLNSPSQTVDVTANGGNAFLDLNSIQTVNSTLVAAGGEAINVGLVSPLSASSQTGGSASVTAGSVSIYNSSFSVTGGEAYNEQSSSISVTGGGAVVTAGSLNLIGTTLAVAAGEANNSSASIFATGSGGNAVGGNAAVTAGSVSILNFSALNVAGGKVDNSDGLMEATTGANASAGSAWVTAGSVTVASSTFSVTGGEMNNRGGLMEAATGAGATAGSASVTVGSLILTGSAATVTGGEVDNTDAIITGSVSAGKASVTVVSLGMTGSSLNVTGGELNDFGGTLASFGPITGSASVSAGSVTLAGSSLNVTGGELVQGGGGSISGASRGNAFLTAASVTLDGTSTLSVIGGSTNGMVVAGSALVSIGSLKGSGTVTVNGGGLSDLQIASGNFAGVIAGNEVLEKQTSGSLILSGANSYSGGTTLEGGLLGLGNNSALGTGGLVMNAATTLQADSNGLSVSNAVTLAGAEIFDSNSNSATLSGVLSGAGSLSVTDSVGGGKLILTNANSYTGGTTVSGGTLVAANSGALGHGNVLVGAGGTLSVSGPLAVNITGTYTQASTGTLRLGLGGVTSGLYDTLSITGAAALGGTLQLASYNGFKIHDAVTLNVLTATTGVSGTFSTVTNGVSGGLLSLTYLPNAVALNLASTAPSFTALGQTNNQKNVGAALDNIATNTPSNSLITYLNSLSNSAFPAVYNQMSPSNLTALFKMGFGTAQAEAGVVGQHVLGTFNTSIQNQSAFDGQGPSFAGNMPAEEEARIAQNISQPSRWSGFVNAMNNFGTVTSDGNGAGYQFNTGGATAGVDYRFEKNLTAGLMIGYDQSSSSQSTGTVNLTGGQMGLYAGYKMDDFHIGALVDGGLDTYTTLRQGLGGNANGSASGTELTGQLNVGYDMKVEDYQVSPFVSGQLTQVNVSGFTETGSLSPLTFGNQGETYLSSDLGAQVSRHFSVWGIKWSPNVSAAWEHIYQGNNDSLSANFGSGNNFTVNGSATGTDGAVLGAGLNAELDKAFNVYASYQGKAGITNLTDQNISGGINLAF